MIWNNLGELKKDYSLVYKDYSLINKIWNFINMWANYNIKLKNRVA